MKALEILLEMQYAYQSTSTPDMLGLDEAIAELKELCGSKQLVYNHKTCETCRYWEQDESIDPNNMFGICENYGIEGKYHFCGHWESK